MRGEFVDLAGHRLYCYAAGTRGAGAPIVLVHGAFTSSHLWREVVPRLPAGHRVLVLDLLGHGRSDLPADADYDLAGHATRLQALLDVLGVEPACVVGHGLGAAIGVELARRAPERVRHLLLANPCLVGTGAEPVPAPAPLRRLARLTPLFRRLPPAWLASTLHTSLLRGYRQRTAGSFVLDVYLKPYRSVAGRAVACRQLQALARPDAAVALDALAAPLAIGVLLGGADPLARRQADRLRGPAALRDDALRAAAPSVAPRPPSGRPDPEFVADVATAIPEEAPDRIATAVAALLAPLT